MPKCSTHSLRGAANNGSAFAGLNANTPWFNLATRRRHPDRPLSADHLPDGGGGSVARKQNVAATTARLRTDTVQFGMFWLAIILIVGALTFFPALVLGPVAEFFAMKASLTF